jgi:hypothetical protein
MLTLDCFDSRGQLRLTAEESLVVSLLDMFDGEIEKVAYAARREIDYICDIVDRIMGKGVTCRVKDPIDRMAEFKQNIAERQKKQMQIKYAVEPPEKTVGSVYRRFRSEYEDIFEEPYPANRKKDLGILRRCLKWAGNDIDLLDDLVGVLVTDWDVLRGILNVKQARPNIHLFGTGWFFEKLRAYVCEGSIDGILAKSDSKERYGDDGSPEIGWE